MDIYEKINQILKIRKITKRKFSELLRNLEPRLKSTGESPSEQTIYKYLSGDINIPIELLSYIAEVLNIIEQELFETTPHTKLKHYNYILKGLDSNKLANMYHINNIKITSNQDVENLVEEQKEELLKLYDLIAFAPKPMITKIISNLEEIKSIILKDI